MLAIGASTTELGEDAVLAMQLLNDSNIPTWSGKEDASVNSISVEPYLCTIHQAYSTQWDHDESYSQEDEHHLHQGKRVSLCPLRKQASAIGY